MNIFQKLKVKVLPGINSLKPNFNVEKNVKQNLTKALKFVIITGTMTVLIISSCSAQKDDSIPIPTHSKIVQPAYYLDDKTLISRLCRIREDILNDPRAFVGQKVTYAFDLYVRAGNAYRDLREKSYQALKSLLTSSNVVEWFFLSGGYGIIHALEAARKYQATFNRNIAYQKGIPYTANLWRDVLPAGCDAIVSKFNPDWIYVFGSQDYTYFIKLADFWENRPNVKIFESTGSSGPFWLSPILSECVESILTNRLNEFNKRYPKFLKQ